MSKKILAKDLKAFSKIKNCFMPSSCVCIPSDWVLFKEKAARF